MRLRTLSTILVLATATSLAHADKPRKPKAPLPAAQYAMHDEHKQEHVTIAAEPGDNKETRPDTRLDYLGHQMMPIRVIVTNDSEKPITLSDARIDFITGDSTKVLAATPDDLNRRFFEMKQAGPKKIPLPGPLPSITYHKKPIDTKILADDADFGFKTTTVKPHETVAGYLFYDMQGLDTPVLKNATLELRKVRWVSGENQQGDALDSFEIPLTGTK
ncbi:hypothetical protein ACFQBQ_13900 [Granulicella cerasi]|uniref:DUF4424 domain-containing protein n=1 Tax=Granulicella cerasi TaxID=741063 RepID=A0ABW1ZB01_9BACT|nr:hypothetical protein [Granulicella cerasi]